ncbi:hypothetical protein LZC95_25720 [Pendulispora brunnea]|uniref:Monooxygenase n=1 Tax=Pendulispora brunnea TaxID=2905690 RepID=A0ABZ2KNF8_9BACT
MTRAIVIGGSLAGMCTARVLGDFFDEVVMLERDLLPEGIAARPGVPQSRHTHVLLPRGEREMEKLFPGFVAAMLAGGAVRFDIGTDMAVRRTFGWQTLGATAEVLWASRNLLEGTMRALFRQQTKVRVIDGVQVLGLLGTPGQVRGVRLRSGTRERELPELLAELVVDASGRNTAIDAWLRELGVTPPQTERVDAHAGYASRFYRPPPRRPADWWWKGLWVEAEPGRPRGGVIFPIEDDCWLVTASGFNRAYPPTDEQGFLAHFASLSSPMASRVLSQAEPISPIHGFRSMANVFRRYERWTAGPAGFVAVGDAACAFNPVYGQGMAASAVCAAILGQVLRRSGPRARFERAFFREQATFLAGPWALATASDFRWPDTEGTRPNVPAAVGRYMKWAIEAAHHDGALRRRLFPAFDLTGTATLLFQPRVVAKVLTSTAGRRLHRRFVGTTPIPESPPAPRR